MQTEIFHADFCLQVDTGSKIHSLLCGHVDAINMTEFARSMLLSNAMALGSVWNLNDSFSLSNNDPFLSMETKVN